MNTWWADILAALFLAIYGYCPAGYALIAGTCIPR